MKLRTPSTALVIISAAVAVVFLAAWGFVAYKSYGMKADIASISANATSAAANDAYLISLKDALRDSKDELAEIDRRFITKDGIPAFIDSIEQSAQAYDVKADLSALDIDESGDASLPRPLTFHMTGSGGWKEVVSFLSAVESMPYALRIEDVSLGKGQGSEWSFNASVTAYVVN
ncbi:MAG TPA: type 4a pilus biogenesis protein PilO [Candidatus Paceibacterota bacterium]|jgi:Tfp pilus assembly protein PilO|nr:type 4a pilus biogenesis protein PilO [Candidatus Paceibacterota bacterium]